MAKTARTFTLGQFFELQAKSKGMRFALIKPNETCAIPLIGFKANEQWRKCVKAGHVLKQNVSDCLYFGNKPVFCQRNGRYALLAGADPRPAGLQ